MIDDTASAPPPPGHRPPALVPNRKSLELPERFGPYISVKELGRGAMGAVFLVRHETLGATYALKVLAPVAVDAAHLVRFEREVQALAALSSHPHIVRIHACGTTAGRPWYVMDHVEGTPLDVVVSKGLLSPRAAVKLGAQLASALETSHRHGVLHRDLKPSNVLIVGDIEAPDGRAMLLDFGLATEPGAHLTQSNEILGTPAFISPEQALSEREKLGPHTDVFGLGTVLHYALTGKRPFGEGSTSALGAIAAVLHADLRPPRELRPEIPARLEAVLVRALEKEPERRFPTARALREALEASLDAAPSAPRARSALALTAVMALIVASLGLVLALALARREPAPPPPPPSPPPPPAVPSPPTPPVAKAASGLEAARPLLAKDPRGAVALAIGGRIPDDEEERRALAAFALEAAERAKRDDAKLALIAQEAAKAGLPGAELAKRLDARLDAMAMSGGITDEAARSAARPLALAALSLRAKRAEDDIFAAGLLLKMPQDPGTPAERVDHDGPMTEAERNAASPALRARLEIRAGRRAEAEAALAAARSAGDDADEIALAELELEGRHDARAALAKLEARGAPASLAGRLLRGWLLSWAAAHDKDEESARAATELLGPIFAESAEREDGRYVATNVALTLLRMEHALGRQHRARAWFARGRIALQGGGREFDEWWPKVFPPE